LGLGEEAKTYLQNTWGKGAAEPRGEGEE